jgi:hypothetical protein
MRSLASAAMVLASLVAASCDCARPDELRLATYPILRPESLDPIEGPATVVATEPWTLRWSGGEQVGLQLDLADPPTGTPVYARLESHHYPFRGVGSRLAVWTIDASGQPGPLALAAWHGDEAVGEGDFGDLTYDNVPGGPRLCAGSCTTPRPRAHRFTYRAQTETIGREGRIGPYEVQVSGVQHEVSDGCNYDSPTSFFTGLVTHQNLTFGGE